METNAIFRESGKNLVKVFTTDFRFLGNIDLRRIHSVLIPYYLEEVYLHILVAVWANYSHSNVKFKYFLLFFRSVSLKIKTWNN